MKIFSLSLCAAVVSLLASQTLAQEDGCTPIKDCKGGLTAGPTCTPSATFGEKGKFSGIPVLEAVCLQCDGQGTVNPSVFPYVTCDGKALCMKIAAVGREVELSPNQARCILADPTKGLACLNQPCTPNADAGSTSAPGSATNSSSNSTTGTTTKPSKGSNGTTNGTSSSNGSGAADASSTTAPPQSDASSVSFSAVAVLASSALSLAVAYAL